MTDPVRYRHVSTKCVDCHRVAYASVRVTLGAVMPYAANVVQVMIVSPNDAAIEREVVRAQLRDVNHVHAREKGTVLLDAGWDTHSSPQLGARGQQVINDQVLESSDVVIAVLKHRIGTPTGQYASGSVEEIQRHHAAGKLTMVYFSDEPPPLDADPAQLAELATFRGWCMENGLIRTYRNAIDLGQQVNREIRLAMNNNQQLRGLSQASGTWGGVGTPNVHGLPAPLSTEAKQLLRGAARDDTGLIVTAETLGGWAIDVGDRTLNEPTARSRASWKRALDELRERGYAVNQGSSGAIFELTEGGYVAADDLAELEPAGAQGAATKETARELESLWNEGDALLNDSAAGSETWSQAARRWESRVEACLSMYDDSERMMFATLDDGVREPANPGTHAYSEQVRQRQRAKLTKLRLVTGRAYQRARL